MSVVGDLHMFSDDVVVAESDVSCASVEQRHGIDVDRRLQITAARIKRVGPFIDIFNHISILIIPILNCFKSWKSEPV